MGAPLPHLQHPRQQLPDAPSPGPAAAHCRGPARRSWAMNGGGAQVGLASGRYAPCVQPNLRRPQGLWDVRAGKTAPKSVQFSVAKNEQFSIAIDTAPLPNAGTSPDTSAAEPGRPPFTLSAHANPAYWRGSSERGSLLSNVLGRLRETGRAVPVCRRLLNRSFSYACVATPH